jgi:hypothetical protein
MASARTTFRISRALTLCWSMRRMVEAASSEVMTSRTPTIVQSDARVRNLSSALICAALID